MKRELLKDKTHIYFLSMDDVKKYKRIIWLGDRPTKVRVMIILSFDYNIYVYI